MRRSWFAVLAVISVIVVGVVFVLATAVRDTDLSTAVEQGSLRSVERLLEEGHPADEPVVLGFTPLMRAAIRDDVEIMNALVGAGADVNAVSTEGIRVIHLAARSNSERAVIRLLELGADPWVRSTNGMNALDHAAEAGAVDVVVVLIDTGMDPDEQSAVIAQGHGYPRDRGAVPLALAARAGQVESVRTLLGRGADVDAVSLTGQTALYAAVYSGQSAELVGALLAAGADTTLITECDEGCSVEPGTAAEWAAALGHDHLVPLLVNG